VSEKVTKEALPDRQELDAKVAEATSGAANVGTAPYVPSAKEQARWEERDRQQLRLNVLALAVQMIGKQTGRTFDVLAEADKLLNWIEGGSVTISVAVPSVD